MKQRIKRQLLRAKHMTVIVNRGGKHVDYERLSDTDLEQCARTGESPIDLVTPIKAEPNVESPPPVVKKT